MLNTTLEARKLVEVCRIGGYRKAVMNMKQADLDKISEIVAEYGFVEWSLVGFTPSGDYQIFSYFTDPSVMPIFKAILVSMLRTVDEYLKRYETEYPEVFHCAGRC